MILKLNLANEKFSSKCKSILFLLKILKKLALYIQQIITEILRGSETDNIIDEFFESLLQRYQKAREESNWFIVLLFS